MHLNSGAYRTHADIESPDDDTCPECEGEGMVLCEHCDGHGRVDGEECPECDGFGDVDCRHCDGKGRV